VFLKKNRFEPSWFQVQAESVLEKPFWQGDVENVLGSKDASLKPPPQLAQMFHPLAVNNPSLLPCTVFL